MFPFGQFYELIMLFSFFYNLTKPMFCKTIPLLIVKRADFFSILLPFGKRMNHSSDSLKISRQPILKMQLIDSLRNVGYLIE